MPLNILILCTHNSARSVLAEGMLNHLARKLGRNVIAHSAGSAPSGRINPFAIEALRAAGVETANLRSKSWDEFSSATSPMLDVVITVCDAAAAESCPILRSAHSSQPVKVHWGYPDPSTVDGDDNAKRRAFELTRQAIAFRLLQLLVLPLETMDQSALRRALEDIGKS